MVTAAKHKPHHDESSGNSERKKYEKELVGHVVQLDGREHPFVVSRTNNLAEHHFGSTKRGVRRRIGVNKLTRYVQAMRAEQLLVANLSVPE